jgi:hypothetical protein
MSNNLEYNNLFYGLYVGFVVSLVDPDNQQRIEVYVPEIFGVGSKPMWAYPKVYGGKNYGIQNMPEKGDALWITCRYGDPRQLVWEHGFYAKNELPEEFKDVTVKGFITSQGTKLIINGKQITVSNSDEYGVEINANVTLGKTSADKQPVALGDETVALLEELINTLKSLIIDVAGTTGTMNQVTSQLLDVTKDKLDNLKSQSVQID